MESSWYLPRVGEDRESRESVKDSRNGEGEGEGALLEPIYIHIYTPNRQRREGGDERREGGRNIDA